MHVVSVKNASHANTPLSHTRVSTFATSPLCSGSEKHCPESYISKPKKIAANKPNIISAVFFQKVLLDKKNLITDNKFHAEFLKSVCH